MLDQQADVGVIDLFDWPRRIHLTIQMRPRCLFEGGARSVELDARSFPICRKPFSFMFSQQPQLRTTSGQDSDGLIHGHDILGQSCGDALC
jgi:hypothetical protein